MEPYSTWSYQTSHLAFDVELSHRKNDHDGVLATIAVSIPSSRVIRRQVYDFRTIDLAKLCNLFEEVSWGDELRSRSADDAAAWLTATVLSLVE